MSDHIQLQGVEVQLAPPVTIQLPGVELQLAPPYTVQLLGVELQLESLSLDGVDLPDPDPIAGLGSSRYLPRWTRAATEADSFTSQFLRTLDAQSQDAAQAVSLLQASRWLPELPEGLTYRRWTVGCPFSLGDDLQLVVSTANYSFPVRRAVSPFDYERTLDPVWWGDRTTGRIFLRNLAAKESEAASASGVYTVSGEDTGFVPDEDVHYRYRTEPGWHRLPCESVVASGSTFTIPASGVLALNYHSQGLLTELEDGVVRISRVGGGTPSLPLEADFQLNLLDGYGRLLGLPRLDGETNGAYKARLLTFLQAPSDTTVGGFLRGVGAELGTLYSTQWDGISSLTLDTNGSLKLREVLVVGVPRLRQFEDELTPASGTTVFTAHCGPWREGALVWIDGIPARNWSISGNRVTFTAPVSGRVTARYSVTSWSTTSDTSGNLRTIAAGTGLPSGSYTVVYAGQVRATTLDLPDTLRDRLLSAAGLPNQLYLDLARLLVQDDPTLFARARWGQASWLSRSEDHPGLSRLVVPFDQTG